MGFGATYTCIRENFYALHYSTLCETGNSKKQTIGFSYWLCAQWTQS